MLIDAGWCWLILVDADWLKHKWERFIGEKNAPKSNCTSSPRKVLTLNWIQSVSSIGIFEHRYPSHVCTRPNTFTETAQLNLLTFYCAQINILLFTMWLNLKLCQNLTWVRLSHFSVVSPNQCAMQCTLCNVHGHSSVQWVEGGGKRLKQVYFIGAGSAMDLVHSAAWERWKGPTLIQYLFTLHCHPTQCTAQKLYLVCVHTATLICVHTLPPWYMCSLFSEHCWHTTTQPTRFNTMQTLQDISSVLETAIDFNCALNYISISLVTSNNV